MYTLSSALKRALVNNSQEAEFSRDSVIETEPSKDGTYIAGLGGTTAPQQVLVIPFVDGAGCDMRLSGWWLLGKPTAGDNDAVWIRLTLVQFKVVAGKFNGLGKRRLRANEFCAKRMLLIAGTVGEHGLIVNDGDIAYAKIDLQGCQKFQFEFTTDPEQPGFGNALFAVTSGF